MHTEQQDDPLSASKHFAPVLEWSPVLQVPSQRIFRRRKKHKHRQILRNRMKSMLNAGLHKHHCSGFHCTTLHANLDETTTTNHIIHLILGMRLLWINPTCRKHVQAHAE